MFLQNSHSCYYAFDMSANVHRNSEIIPTLQTESARCTLEPSRLNEDRRFSKE